MKRGTLPLRWASSPGPFDCWLNTQMIEHSTGNQKVLGSILSGVEAFLFNRKFFQNGLEQIIFISVSEI